MNENELIKIAFMDKYAVWTPSFDKYFKAMKTTASKIPAIVKNYKTDAVTKFKDVSPKAISGTKKFFGKHIGKAGPIATAMFGAASLLKNPQVGKIYGRNAMRFDPNFMKNIK